MTLEALEAFGVSALPPEPDRPRYTYQGTCPRTGEVLSLPRSALAEAVARGLMAQLAIAGEPHGREGKMYGVLVVATPTGERGVLKAFSGLLGGLAVQPGWVPPIPGREQVAGAETETLAQLDRIRAALAQIAQDPAWQDLATLKQTYADRRRTLQQHHQQAKADRQQQRQQLLATLAEPQLSQALADLDRQSQRDGMQRRKLKQEQDAALAPLQARTQALADRRLALRHDRTRLSRQLQAQMHATYALTNFAGHSQSLSEILQGQGIPTGTGDCCAPKLLHAAASGGLRPVGLAEFWWEPDADGSAGTGEQRRSGQFYGACRERCQPMMGFLLSGLTESPLAPLETGSPLAPLETGSPLAPLDKGGKDVKLHPVGAKNMGSSPLLRGTEGDGERLRILYQDQGLLVVDKPAGLLSMPGRRQWDSVLSRLQVQGFGTEFLQTVHRLDQDTSGVLAIARDDSSHRHLSQQFQNRAVEKTYLAIVPGTIHPPQGTIDLPLWGDPEQRPRQSVNFHQGKPSHTAYRVQQTFHHQGQTYSRLELRPRTGRTHQLRVHLADPLGLGCAILGDRLYGAGIHWPKPWPWGDRLHLHAHSLGFTHPQTGQWLEVRSPEFAD